MNIVNIKYGWLRSQSIEPDAHEVWSHRLGRAVFALIFVGLSVLQYRLLQHGL